MAVLRAFCAAFLLLLLAQPGGGAGAASPAPEALRAALQRIDARAAAEHMKDNVGGLTVGIVVGASLVWTRSYGFADMENKAPASEQTVYRIGSVTKQFTALMLLQLIQDGKVSLADPVDRFLPEIATVQTGFARSSSVTLEQLATMTAGLAREPAHLSKYEKGPVSDWERVMISALPETRYDFTPGTQYRYSNIGYAMLGAALARAAGVPYVQYVSERIIAPLGMKDTVFEPTDSMRPRIAKGYGLRAGQASAERSTREHSGRGYRVPNGGLYSTVDDLARFVAFELGHGPETVLRKDTLHSALDRLSSDSARNSYGIGMQVTRDGPLAAYGHNGDVPGYVAAVRFDRESDTAVIVLRNVNGGRFDLRGLTLDLVRETAKL